MSETPASTEIVSSTRPSLWLALLTVFAAAAVWATVAWAAGGSGASGTSSPPASPGAPHAMYAATDSQARDDCPHMGGGSDDGSTTPSAPAPTAPSNQDGSSSPAL